MSNRRMYWISVFCMFFLGFEAGGFQISLLNIAQDLHINGIQNGILVASQYSAIIVMPAIFGKLADRIGKQKILLAFLLVFCIGCFGVSTASVYGIVLLGVFVIGSGYSVCESIVSAILTDTYKEHSGKYLNMVQCFFSLGAVVSPQIVQYGTRQWSWNWEVLFLICGFSYLIIASVLALSIRTKENLSILSADIKKTQGNLQKKKGLSRGFLLLVAAFFIYGGLEVGISFYIDSYIRLEMRNTTMSAHVLSLFWLTMVPARIAGGMLYRYRSSLLWVCYGITAALLGIIILVPYEWPVYLAFIGIGISLGPIWPGLMSMGTEANRENTGLAAGFLSTGCGCGAVLFPILLGASVESLGLKSGFLFLMGMSILGLVLCLKYNIIDKRKKAIAS